MSISGRLRRNLCSITQKLRLPSICALCKQYHREADCVCPPCQSRLKSIEIACHSCAHPLPDAGLPYCGSCIKNKPFFDQTLVSYCYEEPLRTLIHQFKYQANIYLAPFLSKLILQALPEDYNKPQCLIPVPMHPSRLRQRGFNQAAVLTQYLAKKLALPCQLELSKKTVNTLPQAGLDHQKRRSNLQQAFEVKTKGFKHIALIDDLMTTANTTNELAKAFKHAGVEKIDVWCCARTTRTI